MAQGSASSGGAGSRSTGTHRLANDWTPLDLARMRSGGGFYYDFANLASLTLNGGLIEAVQDLSGAGRNGIASGALRPAHTTSGGRTFAQFDAVDDALAISASTSLFQGVAGATLFAIVRPRATGSNRQIFTHLGGSGTARFTLHHNAANTAPTASARRLDADAAISTGADPMSSMATSDWYVLVAVADFAGNTLGVWANGVRASFSAAYPSGSGMTSATAATGPGVLGAGSGLACHCDIAVAGGLSRALAVAEIQQLSEWGMARIGASPAGWGPASIGNLSDWWDLADASRVSTVASGADTVVSSVAPVAGARTLTQATNSARPRYNLADQINGQRAAFFDGLDDVLRVTTGTVNQPDTLCVVFRMQTASVARLLAEGTGSAHAIRGNVAASVWAGIAGITLIGGSADTEPHCMIFHANGASSALHLDGGVLAFGSAGTNPLAGVSLGATGGGANFLEGFIGEALIFSGPLSLTERALLSRWVRRKWRIP